MDGTHAARSPTGYRPEGPIFTILRHRILMSKNKETLQTPSVLGFDRKLSPSDGLMYSGKWEERNSSTAFKAISVREKDVRGTISNRLKGKAETDAVKLNAKVQSPNLQTVDVANLPIGHDTLKISFSLRVLSEIDRPSACNNPAFEEVLSSRVRQYSEEFDLLPLASRYAENIANGRFLWRNRVGAESVEVHVRVVESGKTKTSWSFNSYEFDLHKFSDGSKLQELSEVIAEGFRGRTFRSCLLEVDGFARLGGGQEVFPSQELVLGQRDNQKSKHLYSITDCAALHSQKIGNALRTIDTWHGAPEVGPISVEPYGSVTSRGIAYRQPNEKSDFYTLFDAWVRGKEVDRDQQHFIVATLIRGGVFGEKE